MKVSELIEQLKTMDQDLEVWYSTGEDWYKLPPGGCRREEVENYDTGARRPVCLIGDDL